MQKLLIVSAVAILAGCAGLQEVNESLKKTNAALAGARTVDIGKLGDGTGYQPAITATMPRDVCNRQAFQDGYKDAYLTHWNQFVNDKIQRFTLENKTSKQGAKQNLALYKGRLIGSKGYMGHQMDYQLNLSTINADQCPYNSYTKGQNEARDAVAREMKVLVAQEQ